MLTVQRVALADLTDATPASAFVGFPDCQNTVIALTDVRQLGIEKARDYCKRTDAALFNGIKGVATGFGLFSAVSLILSIALVFIIDSIVKSF